MTSFVSAQPTLSHVGSYRPPKVLVVGDIMLDRTISGFAERTSPEAPVLVLRAAQSESQPGGAAGVARLLAGLKLEICVQLFGVTGQDAAAGELRDPLIRSGVSSEAIVVDPSRPTTLKERFIGQASGRHSQHLLRVDHENTTDLSPSVEEQVLERLVPSIPECSVVLISDYAKGICTSRLLQTVIARCRQAEIPVLVDPARRKDVSRYSGATLIKPNRSWLEMVSGIRVDSLEMANQAMTKLREAYGWLEEQFLVTLDRDGMLRDCPTEGKCHFPSSAREVRDVTGAGDMALAVLGACLALKHPWEEAVRYAGAAAGLQVQKSGVQAIPWSEIHGVVSTRDSNRLQSAPTSRSEGLRKIAAARAAGQRIVFANGCFDLLHAGHIRLLKAAAQLGDFLVVAVNSDASVRRLKGMERPFVPEHERAELLAALGCVGTVLIFEEDTPLNLVQQIQPDVLVKGAEYAAETIVGYDIVTARGGQVVTIPMVPGLSTTQLVKRCREREAAEPANGHQNHHLDARKAVLPLSPTSRSAPD